MRLNGHWRWPVAASPLQWSAWTFLAAMCRLSLTSCSTAGFEYPLAVQTSCHAEIRTNRTHPQLVTAWGRSSPATERPCWSSEFPAVIKRTFARWPVLTNGPVPCADSRATVEGGGVALGRSTAMTHIAGEVTIDAPVDEVFDQVEGGTRLRWEWDMALVGPMRVLSLVLALIGPDWERRNWVGLKKYMESGRR